MAVTRALLALIALGLGVAFAAPFEIDDTDDDLTPVKLLQVNVLWRHGARTPVHVYPNSPNQAGAWPQGLGQLTTKGMLEQYALGASLHDEYITKLSSVGYKLDEEYNPTQVYVRSDDVQRTLMSAYSNLAGMFQKGGDAQAPTANASNGMWPTNWSPIPVHTVAAETDYLLGDNIDCPALRQARDDIVMSPLFQGHAKVYAPVIDHLAEVSGSENLTLANFYELADEVFIEKHWDMDDNDAKIKPATWLDEYVEVPLMEGNTTVNVNKTNYEWVVLMSELADSFFDRSDEAVKLRGGFLLNQILNDMYHTVQKKPVPIFKAYSAHDVTLVNLLRALQNGTQELELSKSGFPKYAAAIAMELWMSKTDKPIVRARYYNGTTPGDGDMPGWHVFTHMITGCPSGETCLWATIKDETAKYTSVTPDDCKMQMPTTTTSTSTMAPTTTQGVSGCVAGVSSLLAMLFAMLRW